MDGDLVGSRLGGDIQAVDADAFADRFEHIGAGASGETDEGAGELDGFGMADLADLFVKEDEGQDGAGRFLRVGLESELWRGEWAAQHGCDRGAG